MQTGRQVYRGLAGLLIVSDDEDASLGLPSGAEELLWVLQDRRFDAQNQFVYSTAMMDMETGFLGDRVLVSGQERPVFSLATRAYRVRVLNGSNARIYKLGWSDSTPIVVLGVDGGLLERPRSQAHVTLAPGQRLDLWLDLSQRPVGATLELRSVAFELADAGMAMGGMGMRMGGDGRIRPLALGAPVSLLTVRVTRKESIPARLPDRLSAFDPTSQPAAGLPDSPDPADVPGDAMDACGPHVRNGRGRRGRNRGRPLHAPVGVRERRRNDGHADGASHSRARPSVSRPQPHRRESGEHAAAMVSWTPAGPTRSWCCRTRPSAFSSHSASIAGLFLYHCHILEHEDMGMMRNYRIT